MITNEKMNSFLKITFRNKYPYKSTNAQISNLHEKWVLLLDKFDIEEIVPDKENVIYMNNFKMWNEIDVASNRLEKDGDGCAYIEACFNAIIKDGQIGLIILKNIILLLGEMGAVDFAYEIAAFGILLEKMVLPDIEGSIFPSFTFMKERSALEEIMRKTYSLLPERFLFKDDCQLNEDEQLMIRKACSKVNTDFSMIFLGHIPLKQNLQAESLKRAYHLYNEFKRNNI